IGERALDTLTLLGGLLVLRRPPGAIGAATVGKSGVLLEYLRNRELALLLPGALEEGMSAGAEAQCIGDRLVSGGVVLRPQGRGKRSELQPQPETPLLGFEMIARGRVERDAKLPLHAMPQLVAKQLSAGLGSIRN